ncbi:MAG: hypothetical protein ACK5V2_07695 [Pseudomonadota bacterium]|jgi:hypothetical protein
MSRRTQALRTAQLSFGTTLALEEASRERLAQAARDNATAPAPSPHMESILAIYAAVEEQRHAAEVRHASALPLADQRRYIAGVGERRGAQAAQRLADSLGDGLYARQLEHEPTDLSEDERRAIDAALRG